MALMLEPLRNSHPTATGAPQPAAPRTAGVDAERDSSSDGVDGVAKLGRLLLGNRRRVDRLG